MVGKAGTSETSGLLSLADEFDPAVGDEKSPIPTRVGMRSVMLLPLGSLIVLPHTVGRRRGFGFPPNLRRYISPALMLVFSPKYRANIAENSESTGGERALRFVSIPLRQTVRDFRIRGARLENRAHARALSRFEGTGEAEYLVSAADFCPILSGADRAGPPCLKR